MIGQWIMRGFEIGTIALAAIFVFLIGCGALMGISALIGSFIKVGNGDE